MANSNLKTALISNQLAEEGVFIDNELQIAFQQLRIGDVLKKSGFNKASGDSLIRFVFAIILWPFFRVNSIFAFAGSGLSAFINGGANVLYDFQKRQDLNWLLFRLIVAMSVYDRHEFTAEKDQALVVDDSVRERTGRKMEGSSRHHDHRTGRTVQGHQVLEFGLACSKGYIPLCSQIYTGDKNPVDRQKKFTNPRSVIAKDFETAKNLNKNQIFRLRLKQILKRGFKPQYVPGTLGSATRRTSRPSRRPV